ncbi:MAG TPA: hypothetical protein VLB04_03380, partial [Methanotrichaceae archaeon]|nr:hypothetical protein [Methanotrichaceae archaeon]
LPGDLPYHANIGAGYQALGIFTEEDMMLRDAFFLLVKARQSLKRFITSIRNAEKNGKSIEEIFEMHNDLGESVATYSRLTVFCFLLIR